MTNTKKYTLAGLIALVLLGVGAAGGRYSLPARVEEKKIEIHHHHTETVLKQDIDMKELIKQVMEQVKKSNVVTERHTIKEGGKETIIEKTTDLSETNTKIDTQIDTMSSIKTSLKLIEDKLDLREENKIVTRVVQNKDTWSMDAQVGYYLPSLWGRDTFNLLPNKGIIAGLSVNRRILGPVWMGAWVNTTGAGGLQLRVSW
jgi:hypothetical protein